MDNRQVGLEDLLAAIQGLREQIGGIREDVNALQNQNADPGGAPDAQVHVVIPDQPPPPPRELRPLDTGSVDKLVGKPTSLDYRTWLNGWESYVVRMRVPRYPRVEQVAALTSCLSKEFLHYYDQNVKPLIVPQVPNQPTTAEIIAAIAAYVRDRNGGLRDRLAFIQRRQQPGEDFEKFWADLQLLGDIAGPCAACHTASLVNLLTVGVLDTNLRHDLLKERPAPDLARCLQLCRAHVSSLRDAAAANASGTTKVTNVNAIANGSAKSGNGSNGGWKKGKNKSFGNKNTKKSSSTKNASTNQQCMNCGRGGGHQDPSQCPAKGQDCHYCETPGHFSSVCRRRARDEASKKNTASVPLVFAKVSFTQQGHVPEPRADVNIIASKGNRRVQLSAVVDSGAAVNVLPTSDLSKFGRAPRDLQRSDVILVGFDGRRRRPVGQIVVDLCVEGQVRTISAVFVVSGGVHEALLGRETALALGAVILPFSNAFSGRNQTVFSVSNVPPLPEVIQHADTPLFIASRRAALLEEYADVFDQTQLKAMVGTPMRIHLTANAKPFAMHVARPIAFGMRDEVEDEIKKMVEKGVIEPVGDEPSDWCHALVVVRKANGKPRVCIDFTKLNMFIKRPAHPFRTPSDAVSGIRPNNATYFSTLDATSGYWQVELAKEDRPLTTFISPWGRYRFIRSPMGLASTGDEYCRRGDIAINGLQHVEKVVDDLLVHSFGLEEHITDVRAVLERCRKHGITLNPTKFTFAQAEVPFVGYMITRQGVEVDMKKVSAIRNFPRPTTVTQVRSFLGLVNQLGNFSTDIATLAGPLRELTRKDIVFQWTPEIERAFDSVKTALTDPPTLAHFDPDCMSVLHTDAARNGGLGFALMQQDPDGVDRLITCGSRVTTPTESRYAVGEIELLAVVWAMNKCKMYLMGRNFKLIVDHRPLVPILNDKGLHELDGRLLRLRQRLTPYSFITEWRRGTDHRVPDALSRAPVDGPDEADRQLEEELTSELEVRINAVEYTFKDMRGGPVRDLRLERIRKTSEEDLELRELRRFIVNGFPASVDKAGLASPFWNVRDNLSVHNDHLVMYGERIVIPASMRKEFLELLHQGHQGVAKTRHLAQETVFWPGINSDIKSTVAACRNCEEARPSLPAEPMMSSPMPDAPFVEIAADVCDYAGHKYLVVVDRYSNWWHLYRYSRAADSEATIKFLQEWMWNWGKALRLRTDGGTNFTSSEMGEWLQSQCIEHMVSAPHYPQSNGLAESAVKAAKKLLAATGCDDPRNPKFKEALIMLRNTPMSDGRPAPAVAIFGGRPLMTLLPQVSQPPSQLKSAPGALGGTLLPPLAVGDKVKIQDHVTGRWELEGVIIRSDVPSRNYEIHTSKGRRLWRNRRHLLLSLQNRDTAAANTSSRPVSSDRTSAGTGTKLDGENDVRRSTRTRKRPSRLIEN